MAWQGVNLPALIPTTTGAGAVTNGIGSLDDAESITIFLVSTANAGSSGATGLTVQISQFDPSIPLPVGVTQSTVWNSLTTNVFSTTVQVTSSGSAFTLTGISYRGIRLSGITSGITGQVVAYATKQIFV